MRERGLYISCRRPFHLRGWTFNKLRASFGFNLKGCLMLMREIRSGVLYMASKWCAARFDAALRCHLGVILCWILCRAEWNLMNERRIAGLLESYFGNLSLVVVVFADWLESEYVNLLHAVQMCRIKGYICWMLRDWLQIPTLSTLFFISKSLFTSTFYNKKLVQVLFILLIYD